MKGITGESAMTRTTEAFESAVAPRYAGLARRLTAVVRATIGSSSSANLTA